MDKNKLNQDDIREQDLKDSKSGKSDHSHDIQILEMLYIVRATRLRH